VVDAAGGEVLNSIRMDEPASGEVVRSSVVASDGQLFIRTTRRLYCIGTEATTGAMRGSRPGAGKG
jgi:hypothetical protein